MAEDAPRQKKRAPNRLIVDDSLGDGDNSCVQLSMAKMEGARISFCHVVVLTFFVGRSPSDCSI